MSLYAFFAQTCQEEHKKKHPDASVNFSELSKKCSERWKTMSAKKGEIWKNGKGWQGSLWKRNENLHPPPQKGRPKRNFKDSNAPKRPPSAFLFCSEYRTKIKGEHPGFSFGGIAKKLGEMWNTAVDDKQPYDKKAASSRRCMRRILLPTELK